LSRGEAACPEYLSGSYATFFYLSHGGAACPEHLSGSYATFFIRRVAKLPVPKFLEKLRDFFLSVAWRSCLSRIFFGKLRDLLGLNSMVETKNS